MTQLNQMELNSIRECVSNHITMASKLTSYASKINDEEIKQMFKTAASDAEKGAQKLLQMI